MPRFANRKHSRINLRQKSWKVKGYGFKPKSYVRRVAKRTYRRRFRRGTRSYLKAPKSGAIRSSPLGQPGTARVVMTSRESITLSIAAASIQRATLSYAATVQKVASEEYQRVFEECKNYRQMRYVGTSYIIENKGADQTLLITSGAIAANVPITVSQSKANTDMHVGMRYRTTNDKDMLNDTWPLREKGFVQVPNGKVAYKAFKLPQQWRQNWVAPTVLLPLQFVNTEGPLIWTVRQQPYAMTAATTNISAEDVNTGILISVSAMPQPPGVTAPLVRDFAVNQQITITCNHAFELKDAIKNYG